jgi:hypothetical protein
MAKKKVKNSRRNTEIGLFTKSSSLDKDQEGESWQRNRLEQKH